MVQCCRYQRGSETCQKLAQSLHHLTTVDERELFDFGSRSVAEAAPLVLILDRKEDPVTPLLMQWTYQAMVHELIGLDNNIANLRQVPGVRFSPLHDEIWKYHQSTIKAHAKVLQNLIVPCDLACGFAFFT